MQANHQAGRFLKDFTDKKFDHAFNRLYFFDGNYDGDVSISEATAKRNWVTRNTKMMNSGTYILSYNGLHIRMNDGWPVGTVNLVMMENGKKKIYKDVHIAFSKKDGTWKIGMLHTTKNVEWDDTFGGHVAK
jgi:hypothetical protein